MTDTPPDVLVAFIIILVGFVIGALWMALNRDYI